VDSERDGHRVAFNQAFEEFGRPDRWDEDLYGQLLDVTGGKRRLHAWLARQGMPEHERDELVPRLHARKNEIFTQLAIDGKVPVRPGVGRLLDELGDEGARLAVATTGSRDWVEPLLARQFGAGRFEVMVTADEAAERKPDPQAYDLVLEKLGLAPAEAVAVEDAAPGLAAAKAAGLACVVVVNDYTAGHDLSAADLVLDSFGEVDAPAGVLADPHHLDPPGRLDAATLRRLAGPSGRG